MLRHFMEGTKFATVSITGKPKRTFDKSFLFESDFNRNPEESRHQMASLKSVVFNMAYFKNGALLMGPNEIIEEHAEILRRCANVFEQTYTRFLDLQKAEAQAREAQIEAALEKVRSRSLAMHKAEELGEVVTVVLEKLRELGIPVNDGVALVTHIEGSKDQIEWMENPGYAAALKVYQPYYEHPILAD
jgi:hypothetical protein